MIEISNLTKSYGSTLAVDDLSFTVRDGVVTGFLGPNGAGKSTTMRMLLGLDNPSKGTATFDGKSYHSLRAPLHEVGALLDAKSFHPGRSARSNLRALAASNHIPTSRVDAVLEQVGLSSVARRRTGKFSLGMGQRLGIAAALLGDPQVLIFDEPINGLDPEGILWVRTLLQALAAEGRTVFYSSHLMSEMAQTATDLVVIGQGRLIADTTVEGFISANTEAAFIVRSSNPEALSLALDGVGAATTQDGGELRVTGIDEVLIGDTALEHGIAIYELAAQRASLEEVFMEVTADAGQFTSQGQNS